MKFLSLLVLACVLGCTPQYSDVPEPTGAWVAANPTQQVATHAPKTSASKQVVPAIDISQR